MIISYSIINDYVLCFPLSFCLKMSIFSKFLLWLFFFISFSAPITLQLTHLSFSSFSVCFSFDPVSFWPNKVFFFLPTSYLFSVSPASNYVFFLFGFILIIWFSWYFVVLWFMGCLKICFFFHCYVLCSIIEFLTFWNWNKVLLCWIYLFAYCFRIVYLVWWNGFKFDFSASSGGCHRVHLDWFIL